jgi:hypothetical protein
VKKIILLIVVSLLALVIYAIPPAEGKFDGRSQSEWLKQLSDASPAQRIQAIAALGEIGIAEYHNTSETRRTALQIMELGGCNCYATMVSSIAQMLQDKDAPVREAAVEALVRIGPYAVLRLNRLANESANAATLWGIKTVFTKFAALPDPALGLAKGSIDWRPLENLNRQAPHPYYARYFPPKENPRPNPLKEFSNEKANKEMERAKKDLDRIYQEAGKSLPNPSKRAEKE